MDLEELIQRTVDKAVRDSMSGITIKNEVISDRWLNKSEAMLVLGIKSYSTLESYQKAGIVKPNKLGNYKYSELLKI